MTKELSGDLEDKILTLTFRRHLKSHFGEVAATFSSITFLYPSLSGSRRFPGSEVLWWICIIPGVLGVILSLIRNLRVRPTREELLRGLTVLVSSKSSGRANFATPSTWLHSVSSMRRSLKQMLMRAKLVSRSIFIERTPLYRFVGGRATLT